MEKTTLMDKYPVFSLTVAKNEISQKSVDEIIEFFKAKVEAHPFATFIAIFDHYAHTTSIADHVLDGNIKAAKNLVFCFGKQLPNSKMLAVRPRSLGVVEFEESFEISFMEVPNEALQKVVSEWVESIKNS
ncbi:MAG: DUF6858 family protein [Sulfurimonas sp.]|jgi:uncharacterized protein YxeA